jgi:hypothetical protein
MNKKNPPKQIKMQTTRPKILSNQINPMSSYILLVLQVGNENVLWIACEPASVEEIFTGRGQAGSLDSIWSTLEYVLVLRTVKLKAKWNNSTMLIFDIITIPAWITRIRHWCCHAD